MNKNIFEEFKNSCEELSNAIKQFGFALRSHQVKNILPRKLKKELKKAAQKEIMMVTKQGATIITSLRLKRQMEQSIHLVLLNTNQN